MQTGYTGITSLYVSKANGDDRALGISPKEPLKTLEAALGIVADMRRFGCEQPVSVLIMDEIYHMERPLRIGVPNGNFYGRAPQVSYVTFAPYGHARAMLCGGRRLQGFSPAVFQGKNCFAIHLPEVEDGTWNFTDLYVGGVPAKRPRLPKTGYFYPEATENDVPATHVPSHWFIAQQGDIPENIRNVSDVTVNFCHYWVDEHGAIATFDPESRKVTFAGKTRMTITAKKDQAATMAYWLENVAEAFGEAGEWYLDRPSGMLYYMPKPGEDMEKLEIYAPVTERLLEVVGDLEQERAVCGICLSHLDLAYTKGDYVNRQKQPDGSFEISMADGQSMPGLYGVVDMTAAHGCAIEHCHFYAYGAGGVVFGKGCCDCRVEDCSFTHGGGGGVSIKGGSESEPAFSHAHHNRIMDCRMLYLGERHFSASGVLVTHGYANEISHNEIGELFYSGICVGWRWGYGATVCRDNLIFKNHIHHLGKGFLSDMGGIYTLGAQPGMRVEGNLIHHVESRNYGGWGLYTDEGSSYITLKDNICCFCSSNGYHQHYGAMNRVYNNIFAFSGHELVCMTRREPHVGLLLERNVFLPEEGKAVYSNVTAADFVSDGNLICADDPVMLRVGEEALGLAAFTAAYGMDVHSVVNDVDRATLEQAVAHPFCLWSPKSAEPLGFTPIDMRDVGPRTAK